jgi:hypothetical protein
LSPSALAERAGPIRLAAALSANVMLRIHGDTGSLLAALAAKWFDQQPQIPPPFKPQVRPIRRLPGPLR